MDQSSLDSQIETLNPSQRDAVMAPEGPMLVIAGAGSGKTRVLTMRIAYLLSKGVKPYNILALTFTNKAAGEMKERIAKIVGSAARDLWMGTFHSVFSRIIRAEAQTLGISPDFTIYDSEDSSKLIKSIVKELGLEDASSYKPKDIAGVISAAKNDIILPHAYAQNPDFAYRDTAARRPKTAHIYQRYVEECRKANALDFDDLLLFTNILFSEHPDALAKYQQRFTHILVDEYQDTNMVQYAIVNRLAKGHHNLCVVGDDAQSIYSFRGARIENILNFRKDYPEAQTFKLEQNYRSTQNIVATANKLIANNRNQIVKNVFSKGDVGEKVHIWANDDDRAEARRVVNDIAHRTGRGSLSFSDCAILYRNNFLSRVMEEQLRQAAIPYRIYGGLAFYQRKEVKDVIAYLRLVVNHNDIEALRRIINYPKRQIGDTTVDKIESTARSLGSTPWDVMTISSQLAHASLRDAAIAKLSRFTALIDTLTQQSQQMDAYQLAVETLSQSGMLQLLNEEKINNEGKERYANVQELLNGIKEFTENQEEEDAPTTVAEYLQQVSLITDMDQKDDGDKVNLMTIHASKGLEFGSVYIVGVEEDIFPGERCALDPKALEEERRLMYVALTRAKDIATVSYARSRFRFGKTEPCVRSCFVTELDPKYCDGTEARRQPVTSDAASFANPWGTPRRDYPSQRPTEQSYRPKTAFSAPAPPSGFKRVERRLTTSDLNIADADALMQTPDGKFRIQMRINHSRFGNGTIKEITGSNADDMKLKISFDQGGEKTLLLKFARIEAI